MLSSWTNFQKKRINGCRYTRKDKGPDHLRNYGILDVFPLVQPSVFAGEHNVGWRTKTGAKDIAKFFWLSKKNGISIAKECWILSTLLYLLTRKVGNFIGTVQQSGRWLCICVCMCVGVGVEVACVHAIAIPKSIVLYFHHCQAYTTSAFTCWATLPAL